MTSLTGKSGTGSGTKKDSGFSGKSGFSKTESNVLSKSSTPGKSYTPSSLSSSKSGKSSSSFGIIWIPTKKRIKKDYTYNSHQYKQKERSPSMYQLMESPNKDFFKEKSESELREEGSKADGLTFRGDDIVATAGAGISLDTSSEIHDNQDNKLQPRFLAMTVSDPAKIDTEDIDFSSNKNLLEKIVETKEDDNEDDDKKDERDYLDNTNKTSEVHEKGNSKSEDSIDGTFQDQKNPKKIPPVADQPEESDWLVNCIYYGLVCCDCVIM